MPFRLGLKEICIHKLKILIQINSRDTQCDQQGTRLGHRDQFNSGFAIGLMGNLEQDTSHLYFPVNLLIYLYCGLEEGIVPCFVFVWRLAQ